MNITKITNELRTNGYAISDYDVEVAFDKWDSIDKEVDNYIDNNNLDNLENNDEIRAHFEKYEKYFDGANQACIVDFEKFCEIEFEADQVNGDLEHPSDDPDFTFEEVFDERLVEYNNEDDEKIKNELESFVCETSDGVTLFEADVHSHELINGDNGAVWNIKAYTNEELYIISKTQHKEVGKNKIVLKISHKEFLNEQIKYYSRFVNMSAVCNELNIDYQNVNKFIKGDLNRLSATAATTIIEALLKRPISK
ncbi:MAG: hypothetical protein RR571_05700 [Anaerorhabdus sp.]